MIAIKRELGESPKQSRCCKFHYVFTSDPIATGISSGKAFVNRNKSEDLPCKTFIIAFEEKAV